VVSASGTSDDPPGNGQTVAQRLFPYVLPYLVRKPATYGFAAFNGRTLAGNAPEAMLSFVTNTRCALRAQTLRIRASKAWSQVGGQGQSRTAPTLRFQA
jgi:hypothetical protein